MDHPADLDAWVRAVFDPASDEQADNSSGADVAVPDLSCSDSVLRRIAAVYSDPCRYLGRFTDAQLGDGLYRLMSPGESDAACAIADAQIPWETRRVALDSTAVLFERLLAPRCGRTYDEWKRGLTSSLGHTCFMWWDVGGPNLSSAPEVEALAWLSVVQRTLRLKSVACQFSALHGLGEWHSCIPHLTVPVIDGFLAGCADLCPEVRTYAQAARAGEVL